MNQFRSRRQSRVSDCRALSRQGKQRNLACRSRSPLAAVGVSMTRPHRPCLLSAGRRQVRGVRQSSYCLIAQGDVPVRYASRQHSTVQARADQGRGIFQRQMPSMMRLSSTPPNHSAYKRHMLLSLSSTRRHIVRVDKAGLFSRRIPGYRACVRQQASNAAIPGAPVSSFPTSSTRVSTRLIA